VLSHHAPCLAHEETPLGPTGPSGANASSYGPG
jgi:hypothetical protein